MMRLAFITDAPAHPVYTAHDSYRNLVRETAHGISGNCDAAVLTCCPDVKVHLVSRDFNMCCNRALSNVRHCKCLGKHSHGDNTSCLVAVYSSDTVAVPLLSSPVGPGFDPVYVLYVLVRQSSVAARVAVFLIPEGLQCLPALKVAVA